MIALRTDRELDLMTEANRIVGMAHRALKPMVLAGVKTSELDAIAEDVIRTHGAVPAFKGYHGYPATICISINEQVVHGIPGDRTLQEGDIVSIDIGAKYRGYFGDQAITRTVGDISAREQELLTITRQSLFEGIEHALAGGRLSDICGCIQKYVEEHGFSVVRQFVGHGIGRKLHEDPPVPNYAPPDRNPRLRKGMVLAIEPMVNMGKPDVVVANDGWTASAIDGLPSAHFEHVVAITQEAPRLLTMTEDQIDGE